MVSFTVLGLRRFFVSPTGRGIFVVLMVALLLTSIGKAQNLLMVNPSFETADGAFGRGDFKYTGWEGSNYRWGFVGTKSPGAPGAGSKSFAITHGGYLQTAQDSLPAVKGGYPYLLTFQCQKPMDDQPTQWLGLLPSIIFYDQSGAVLRTVWGQQAMSNGTSGWQTVRLLGTAPENAVKARVRVELNSGSYPHEDGRGFEVDDFSLMQVADEPTLGFRHGAMDIEPGSNAEVVVKYRTPDADDLLVRLVKGDSGVVETRVAGVHGRGLATAQVPVPKDAATGADYAWYAELVKAGTNWDAHGKPINLGGVSLDDALKTGQSVKADDPNLVCEGRWLKDKDGHPRALWQGSSVRARFTGTSFAMKYTYASWDVRHRLDLRIIVDGTDLTPKDPMALPQGTNLKGTLATGLSAGVHTIDVIRDGEEDTTLWELDGVELDAGCGLLHDQPFMNRRIDFYGDSTCSGGMGGMAVNYTMTTARALGASAVVVSKGATGVSGGFVFNYNALYYWDRFNFDVFFGSHKENCPRNPYAATPVVDPNQARGEAWGPGNFDKYGDPNKWAEIADKGHFADSPADAVVIGYGQNDQFGQGPFQSNYRQFVTVLRKVYPKAQIFMTHTNMTANEGYFKSAMEPIINDCGPGGLNSDGRIHMMILHPTGNTNGQHPSAQDHQNLALGNKDWRGVADWIEDTMGWSGAPVGDALETAAPGVSVPAGTYAAAQTVVLSSYTPGAVVHYTIDGSQPTDQSPTYDSPLTIQSDTTVKVLATSIGLPTSNVAVFAYKIQPAKP